MRMTNGYDVTEFQPVEEITWMGSDSDVVDAARVSFDNSACNYSGEQNEKLIQYLAKHNHWSPFAHCSIKFRFKAPIFIARQFQKHQIGFAWNEVSRRYVDRDPQFFVPDSWRKRPDTIKQGSTTEGEIPIEDGKLSSYVYKMREHAKDYRELRLSGICPEQARMILPQSMMTEWIWTGSLIGWARFVELRLDSHAQMECWPYAEMVRAYMYQLFPVSTRALLGYDGH